MPGFSVDAGGVCGIGAGRGAVKLGLWGSLGSTDQAQGCGRQSAKAEANSQPLVLGLAQYLQLRGEAVGKEQGGCTSTWCSAKEARG